MIMKLFYNNYCWLVLLDDLTTIIFLIAALLMILSGLKH